jgi:plastocyanin
MRKLSGLFGALMLVSALVSCGGGDTNVTPPPPQCGTATFCTTISNTFTPLTMTVAVGSTVTWDNESGQPHNVTWDTAAGRTAAAAGDGTGDMDLPSALGTAHTRVFNTAGTFGFHCTIHPGMNGTLTVQ